MNERVKQLAEQATRKYDRLGNEIPFAQPDLEKFAELIVKECSNIDFRHIVGVSHDHDFKISETIKRHFGVE